MSETLSDQRFGPFLRRLKIKNYKSIGTCDVELRPLTVLVGRNGAGKSNVVDAIHFVIDALGSSLDLAIKARGGIDGVRRYSTGHPRNFAIGLELTLPGGRFASYGFEIAAREGGSFAVKQEQLRVSDHLDRTLASYSRDQDEVSIPEVDHPPPVFSDRLYLGNAAGFPGFREVYDALLSMGFYQLNPEAMKELQNPDAGELLRGDGSNLASVVARLAADRPADLERIHEYLQVIVPDITRIEREALGPRETLRFYQKVKGSQHPWKFYASSMSDGTLRALGALVAVTQLASHHQPVHLVAIEEPETALHPAAAGALMDALREGSRHTQVLLTSHSPDLLDQVEVDDDGLLVVLNREGTTFVGAIDPASREAIHRHLFKPGELLRMDQLMADPDDLERQEQMKLFPAPTAA